MKQRIKVAELVIKETCVVYDTIKVNVSSVAAEAFKKHSEGRPTENFMVLLLDTKHTITEILTVSVGTLTTALVHPREVFRPAILKGAAAVIVGHNHPSGDSTPSKEDQRVTERLKKVGELLGIPLLDHIIIGDSEFNYGLPDLRDKGQF